VGNAHRKAVRRVSVITHALRFRRSRSRHDTAAPVRRRGSV